MTKRKPLAPDDARAQRDRLMASAAQGQLALTDGLRQMRSISGLTQEQFAQHRGVGTRVVKALEAGQGNPTVATLNRIAQVFGLEVAFVPSKRLRDGPRAVAVPTELHEALVDMEADVARQHARLKKMIGGLASDP